MAKLHFDFFECSFRHDATARPNEYEFKLARHF